MYSVFIHNVNHVYNVYIYTLYIYTFIVPKLPPFQVGPKYPP